MSMQLLETGASKNDYIVLNGTVRFMILCMFLGEMVSQHLVSCRNDFYRSASWIFAEKKTLDCGAIIFFSNKSFRNVHCHLLTIRTSGNFAPTHSSNVLLIWKHNKSHTTYAFQNLLENPTLKLVILSLLCIGDLLIWKFCNLEIWRFPSFLETPDCI